MCGINAIISLKHSLDGTHAIQRMNRALFHRGPDRNNYMKVPHPSASIYLGSTVLRVTGYKETDQPSQFENSFLCYNGQVYNAYELALEANLVTDLDKNVYSDTYLIHLLIELKYI